MKKTGQSVSWAELRQTNIAEFSLPYALLTVENQPKNRALVRAGSQQDSWEFNASSSGGGSKFKQPSIQLGNDGVVHIYSRPLKNPGL